MMDVLLARERTDQFQRDHSLTCSQVQSDPLAAAWRSALDTAIGQGMLAVHS